jgi:predicted nucleotidyltransferase
MRRADALALLQAHRAEFAAAGVVRLALFGSLARDEADAGSDVDLLVAFDRPIGLFDFIRLQERLENILGRPVDLVTEDALKRQLRARILSEAIDAA